MCLARSWHMWRLFMTKYIAKTSPLVPLSSSPIRHLADTALLARRLIRTLNCQKTLKVMLMNWGACVWAQTTQKTSMTTHSFTFTVAAALAQKRNVWNCKATRGKRQHVLTAATREAAGYCPGCLYSTNLIALLAPPSFITTYSTYRLPACFSDIFLLMFIFSTSCSAGAESIAALSRYSDLITGIKPVPGNTASCISRRLIAWSRSNFATITKNII